MTTESAASPGAVLALGLGASAGLAAGALGIGGGLLLVPMLTLLLGTPLKRAIGTSLLGVLVTAVVAVATECLTAPANIHWLAASLLAAGAIAGSAAGARLVARLPTARLAALLAGLLLLGALKMSGLLGLLLGSASAGSRLALGAGEGLPFVLAHVGGGLGAGLISATFGVGGGILAVPLLAVLHPDWTFQACRATSLAMIVPTALSGAILHRRLTNVDAALAAALVPGVALGAVAGVLVANRVPGRVLEIAFAILLAIAAFRILHRVRRRPATS